MRWVVVWFVLLPLYSSEESPPAHVLMAQRLLSSLPKIPEVIQGQMDGRPEELKKMVSSVLGDGLISQLVVNPMGVAEEMGMSMDSLGLNKTEVIEKLNNATNGMAGSFLENQHHSINNGTSLFGNMPIQNLFTPSSTTTTAPKYYVDGVLVSDDFINKHNALDDQGNLIFKTSKPTTTITTPMPSAQQIADSVLDALKKSVGSDNIAAINTPAPPTSDIASSFDLGLVDPKRINEVSHLLRRAPQRFDTLSDVLPSVASMPAPAPAMLDPQIGNVLTTLRSKSITGLTVEEVKQLQGALQQYEQTLQTKELFTKRKQLQVLQTELIEQKRRIEEQKRMEEILRQKEKELEQKRQEMEHQLQVQLNSWHSSFNSHPPGADVPTPSLLDRAVTSSLSDPMNMEGLSDLNLYNRFPSSHETVLPPTDIGSTIGSSSISSHAPLPKSFSEGPSFSITPSYSHPSPPSAPSSFKIDQEEDRSSALPSPPSKPSHPPSPLSQLRYSIPAVNDKAREIFEEAPEGDQHDDEFSSSCECIEVSLEKMQGTWVQALASKNVIAKTEKTLSTLLEKKEPVHLNCSRYDFSRPLRSSSAQDTRVVWEFRTTDSSRQYRLSGSALSIDHITTRVQLKDLKGNKFSMPFCVLKYGGKSVKYDYMVIVNSGGPCNEASLLVRDDTFFDNHDSELVKFLKHRISQGDMDPMNIVPYANDCRH